MARPRKVRPIPTLADHTGIDGFTATHDNNITTAEYAIQSLPANLAITESNLTAVLTGGHFLNGIV